MDRYLANVLHARVLVENTRKETEMDSTKTEKEFMQAREDRDIAYHKEVMKQIDHENKRWEEFEAKADERHRVDVDICVDQRKQLTRLADAFEGMLAEIKKIREMADKVR